MSQGDVDCMYANPGYVLWSELFVCRTCTINLVDANFEEVVYAKAPFCLSACMHRLQVLQSG